MLVLLVEALFGGSTILSLVCRIKRQRVEWLHNAKDRPFAIDDLLTVLCVTDEHASTIVASVESHYAAKKPSLPFRIVLVSDNAGPAVKQAHAELVGKYPGLLLFLKEDLARQEYVLNVDDVALQRALNVVLEENMYLGAMPLPGLGSCGH